LDENIVVVGVDPGMASTGFCVIAISRADLHSVPGPMLSTRIQVYSAGLICTDKDSRQGKVTNDRANRIGDIVRSIDFVWAETMRALPLARPIIACEVFNLMPGVRITNASAQSIAVYGAVAGLTVARGGTFIPTQPASGKKLLTGLPKSSKDQVIAAAKEFLDGKMHPKFKWPPSKAEHPSDALCVCLASLVELQHL